MKNRIRILPFVCLLIGCIGTGYAQTDPFLSNSTATLHVIPDSNGSLVSPWILDQADTRDTSQVCVTYRLDYVYDTSKQLTRMNRMQMQIGSIWIKYYGLRRELEDGIWSQRQNALQQLPLNIIPKFALSNDIRTQQEYAGDRNINGEIWTSRTEQKLIARYHHLNRHHTALTYEEPIPQIQWKLAPQTDSICGCLCHVATTKLRGRSWSVWYTSEIPLSYGPWIFSGLPGLVLRAEDSTGSYRWECERIENDHVPIIWYDVNRQDITRKNCLQFFKVFYANPYNYIRETNATTGSFKIIGPEHKTLDRSWTIPYNPIELE
ncbi:MAG: GLPGLI family protein [Bacteroidales bacterium]